MQKSSLLSSLVFRSGVLALASASALLLAGCGDKGKSSASGSAPAQTGAAPASGDAKLDSADQRVSYGVGYNMGASLARQKALQIDQAALLAGIQDGVAGAKLRLAEQDIQAAFEAVDARAAKAAEEAGKANLAAATAFLDKNKARAGVTTTASGLQYEVIKSGSGPKPKATDRVRVHYHGTLISGEVFDSSVERGEPAEFAVQGVIPGWTEALQLMSVGDKWKLFIPAALAYGPRHAGGIPPNSALVFEVELLEVK